MTIKRTMEDDFFPLPESEEKMTPRIMQDMLHLTLDPLSRHYVETERGFKRTIIWEKGAWYLYLFNIKTGKERKLPWMTRKEWDSMVPVPELDRLFSGWES